MSNGRIIRDERADPEQSLLDRQRMVRRTIATTDPRRVLAPYFPREPQPMAGAPEGESGVFVSWNELDDDLKSRITNAQASEASPRQYRFSGIAAGQTVFNLPEVPVAVAPVIFSVNGIDYVEEVHFTRAGGTLTWMNVEFSIDVTDRVEVFYFV